MAASKWGTEDQQGAAREITADVTLKALLSRTTGQVIDLTQPLSPGSPRDPEQSPYSICMWSHPGPSSSAHRSDGAVNGIGFAVERVELDLHTGTHLDALGHCTVNGQMYNDFAAQDVVTNRGLAKLGIENVPPLITRGVLVDLPAAYGRPLEAGEVVSVEAVRHALDRQQSQVIPGDIVLFRTGWAQFYGVDNQRYLAGWPGIGVDVARWLVEKRIAAVGADTLGLEVWPGEDPHIQWPVHHELLVRAGVYIIEHANLETAARLLAHEFLCVCLPIRFVGGTASPIRLTAVL